MLGALASYRKRKRPEAFHATIAWIYNHPRTERMEHFPGYRDYFVGAQARASELGYQVEPFWVKSGEKSLQALSRVLKVRGIRGVIIAPQARPEQVLPLDWENFASVAIGYTLREAKIDRVTNDHFGTMVELLERLHSHGYRRIGCYLWEVDNVRMAERARSAFLSVSQNYGTTVEVYPHFDAECFIRWLKKGQFDALGCRGSEQLLALEAAGLRVPKDLGLAAYALDEQATVLSGMCHNNRRIGAAAAEWVSGKLQRGQFGFNDASQHLLISSKWLENKTLRSGLLKSHSMAPLALESKLTEF
jgi:DNA-binding LacI/PurR family transcriptional regulator